MGLVRKDFIRKENVFRNIMDGILSFVDFSNGLLVIYIFVFLIAFVITNIF